MDLQYLEQAAQVIFEMCRLHPEICPHKYSWTLTRYLEDGKAEKHYTCGLCGHKIIREE